MGPFFAYHPAERSLVFPIFMGDKPVRAESVPVAALRASGWDVTDGQLVTALPRIGAPALTLAASDRDVQVAAAARNVVDRIKR